MDETITWNVGTSVLNPSYAGIKVISNPHMTDDQAVMLPSGEAVMSPSMFAKLQERVIQEVNKKTGIWPSASETPLTIDVLNRAKERVKEITAPVDKEKVAMEANPSWGAF